MSSPLWKEVYIERKVEEQKLFPFRVDLFSLGIQNNFENVLPPLKVCPLP